MDKYIKLITQKHIVLIKLTKEEQMMNIKKCISAVVGLCVLFNASPIPVKAAVTTINEAVTTIPPEQLAANFHSAVLPKVMKNREIPNVFSTRDDKIVQINDYEWGVLYLTNKIRMINGLEPLSASTNLQDAANIRKNELKTLFSHTRPNGSTCDTVLAECGVTFNYAGENIAAGQEDPFTVVNAWWNSEGHRTNMLYQNYTHLGIGYSYNGNDLYGNYWVQLFTGNCTPASISLIQDNSVPYIITTDQSIDEIGLELSISCHHGTSYLPVIEEMCSPLDRSLLGEPQAITISYNGKSTTVNLVVYEPMTFEDISPDGWYYSSVAEAYYNGIMTGLDKKHFGPSDPLARAQFAVILHRLTGEENVEYRPAFPDVADGIWYTDAIMWASEAGIVNGYTDTGLFGPGDSINREQMAVMMYRFAQYLGIDTSGRADYSHFTDAKSVNAFAQDAMSWAIYTGIITGKDNGAIIDPQGNANRAECATIIMRFIHYCEE